MREYLEKLRDYRVLYNFYKLDYIKSELRYHKDLLAELLSSQIEENFMFRRGSQDDYVISVSVFAYVEGRLENEYEEIEKLKKEQHRKNSRKFTKLTQKEKSEIWEKIWAKAISDCAQNGKCFDKQLLENIRNYKEEKYKNE